MIFSIHIPHIDVYIERTIFLNGKKKVGEVVVCLITNLRTSFDDSRDTRRQMTVKLSDLDSPMNYLKAPNQRRHKGNNRHKRQNKTVSRLRETGLNAKFHSEDFMVEC